MFCFSGGLSYITQNIPGNMMQKTIIIVQGPTGGGPLTLTVCIPFYYIHSNVGHVGKKYLIVRPHITPNTCEVIY